MLRNIFEGEEGSCMTLYEISSTYAAFFAAVENGDIPEEAITDTLQGLSGEFDSKVDNIACYIKGLQADVAAIKAEESKLAERRRAKEALIERYKQYLIYNMEQTGRKKVETPRNLLSLRSGKSVCVHDVTLLPEEYIKTTRTAVKTDIKKALESGIQIPGCEIRETNSLIMK